MKKLLVALIASAFAFTAFAQAQKAEPAAPKGQTGVETRKAEPDFFPVIEIVLENNQPTTQASIRFPESSDGLGRGHRLVQRLLHGLSRVRGEWIVVMDCDLQDRPEEVPRLWAKALEGFDIVRAKRVNRSDAWYRRFFSEAFYAFLSYLTDTHQNPEFSNFGIYSRKVIDVVTQWQEEAKYFPAIVSWVGFSQSTLAVEQDRRFSGPSSYTFAKLVKLGVNVIVGFSDKPLKLVMVAGFAMALLSFGMALFILVSHLMGVLTVEGWASIALSLWFLAGCLLFALGLTGLYVGRILVEVKGRPSFIIDRVLIHAWEDARSENHVGPVPVDGSSH